MDEMIEKAEGYLNECIAFLQELAKYKDSDYRTLLECTDEELPNYIGSSYIADVIIERRVQGLPLDSADAIIEVLSNVEFDCDDDYNVGVNDGKLWMLARIFETFDMRTSAAEALTWIYKK